MTNDDKLPVYAAWEKYKEENEPIGMASFFYLDNAQYFKAGFNAGYDNSNAKIKELEEQVTMLKNGLTEIMNKDGMCIFGSMNTSDNADIAFRQGSAYSNSECARIASTTLARLDTASSQEE